jgi:hypothetical protein
LSKTERSIREANRSVERGVTRCCEADGGEAVAVRRAYEEGRAL